MKAFLISLTLIFSSCSTVYYNFWEKLGKEKRDLLRGKLLDADQGQNEIKKHFKDALDRMRKTYEFKEGKLEKAYDLLLSDYNDAKEKSEEFQGDIDRAEEIAKDLFKEWKKEASQLSNKKYKQDSYNKLKLTKNEFNRVLKKMRMVEKDLNKVLKTFKDEVIYIKHNLNAKLIGSLSLKLNQIENGINKLIQTINSSSKDAQKIITDLK